MFKMLKKIGWIWKMGPTAKGWCSVSEVELLDDFATISNYLYVEKIASKSK